MRHCTAPQRVMEPQGALDDRDKNSKIFIIGP